MLASPDGDVIQDASAHLAVCVPGLNVTAGSRRRGRAIR
jgi:hypothetical protein